MKKEVLIMNLGLKKLIAAGILTVTVLSLSTVALAAATTQQVALTPAATQTFVCPNGNDVCIQNGACMNNGVCVNNGECPSNGVPKRDGTGYQRGRGNGCGNGAGNRGGCYLR